MCEIKEENRTIELYSNIEFPLLSHSLYLFFSKFFSALISASIFCDSSVKVVVRFTPLSFGIRAVILAMAVNERWCLEAQTVLDGVLARLKVMMAEIDEKIAR